MASGIAFTAADTARLAPTAALSAAIKVRDNSAFTSTFDEAKIVGTFKPTRTLVVSQSVPPGTLVQVGTPIDLTLTVKETLPVGGFKAIDPKVTAKFADKSVGDVAASYGADVKNVLDREDAADYDKLSAADKAVVNAYIKSTYEVDAAADAAGAKSAYNSIKFLHDL